MTETRVASRDDTSDEAEIVALLADEYVRDILEETIEDAKPAKEIVEETDASKATVYRRIDEMVEQELLVEKRRIRDDGSNYGVYEATIDRVVIDIEPPVDGEPPFAVSVETVSPSTNRVADIWGDIRDSN